jgi:hypothetical protein
MDEFDAFHRPSWNVSDEYVAMIFARRGKWSVVEAMYDAGKRLDKWTVVAAAQQNDVARLQWLHDRVPDAFDPIVASECARNNAADALRWLLGLYAYDVASVVYWANWHRHFNVARVAIDVLYKRSTARVLVPTP